VLLNLNLEIKLHFRKFSLLILRWTLVDTQLGFHSIIRYHMVRFDTLQGSFSFKDHMCLLSQVDWDKVLGNAF
jgi:hypothetical protein